VTKAKTAKPAAVVSGERLAKRIARAGLCSRREAERWIEAGRVAIDGNIVASPAINVDGQTAITVDGKRLPKVAHARLWLYHKPRGLVTTHQDPEGRPTVFAQLPPELPRVISVGRLDLNSEGLLLLTNDGGLARQLERPATGLQRRYRVRAFGRIEQAALDRLSKGVTVNGVRYGKITAKIEKRQGANVWLGFDISEGKNREVRKVLEHLGLRVNRLIRVAYGPFQLGQLSQGRASEVPRRIMEKWVMQKEPRKK